MINKQAIEIVEELLANLKVGTIIADETIVHEAKRGGYILGKNGSVLDKVVELRLREAPKKKYKSQAEIYEILYDMHYEFIHDDIREFESKKLPEGTACIELSDRGVDNAKRKATKYAVENTVLVWREQYA